MIVVLPFCNRDGALLLKNLQWMSELEVNSRCLLSWDATTSPQVVEQMKVAAKRAFRDVLLHRYDPPKPQYWPPNHAWQEAARFMVKVNEPWLWMEADMVPLCKGWMNDLEREYIKRQKPFMGPIIQVLGHCNGTAIYPADTPTRLKRAMIEYRDAWDVVAKDEMVPHCHDSTPLTQHAWTGDANGLHVFAGGSAPTFPTRSHLRFITPTAVVFHRCKDGSLIDRLRECKREV